MPIGEQTTNFLNIFGFGFALKAFAILFVIFYIFFAFLIFRQTQLMLKAVPTAVSPFIKFVAILQMGVALALLFAVMGVF